MKPGWTRLPEWWRRGRAVAGGYFWLPCHLCGQWFGGHEVVEPRFEFTEMDGGPQKIPCPDCTRRKEQADIARARELGWVIPDDLLSPDAKGSGS